MSNSITKPPTQGLSAAEILSSRAQYGSNKLFATEKRGIGKILLEVVLEPMFLLLIIACALYFILGKTDEGFMLVAASIIVSAISFFQTIKSESALDKLKKLTQPTVTVLRDKSIQEIPVEEIVVGDIIQIAEGRIVPADAEVIHASDFSIDEAMLTGESIPVNKVIKDKVFAGTIATSGLIFAKVSAIGAETSLGKLGKSIQNIKSEKSHLQKQIVKFVQRMAYIGIVAFLLIWGINYLKSGDIYASLLFGLTIAMSIIPEEIPVAFSSFMAIGASRMTNLGVLVKNPQTVESLGAATVICVDKTGTITEDGMYLKTLWLADSQQTVELDELIEHKAMDTVASCQPILYYAMLASEELPFDAMEKAIIESNKQFFPEEKLPSKIHEYPLSGTPPMMTHVYKNKAGEILVAAKGGLEKILSICKITDTEQAKILDTAKTFSSKGLRVLGIAQGKHTGSAMPATQEEFEWSFLGFIGLLNPPKKNAARVVSDFHTAHIKVKMITGDSPETAMAIANEIGLKHADVFITGETIMAMSATELKKTAKKINVFARMFPEAKLKVVNALKSAGEIVAMTGDGVNDGPALKAAHIGIAMGIRGSEVAKQAASLVLIADDLDSMVDAIEQGRKIYQNLKKAISYIVSIHIPIILAVAVPLIANWKYPNIFSPVHIIFLELVMGPTCSIAFENEPAEANIMTQKPRNSKASFLAGKALALSLIQGLVIAIAILGIYYWAIEAGYNKEEVRTMAFITLVLSNIFLTLTNRSAVYSFIETLQYKNGLLWIMLSLTVLILVCTLYIPSVEALFEFAPLSNIEILLCLTAAFLGVFWIELYKWFGKKPRR